MSVLSHCAPAVALLLATPGIDPLEANAVRRVQVPLCVGFLMRESLFAFTGGQDSAGTCAETPEFRCCRSFNGRPTRGSGTRSSQHLRGLGYGGDCVWGGGRGPCGACPSYGGPGHDSAGSPTGRLWGWFMGQYDTFLCAL